MKLSFKAYSTQTEQVEARMHGYEDYIYNIDSGEGTFEENRSKIVEFLKSQDCGMGLGRGLRHYMCKKYATPVKDDDGEITGFMFELSDGRKIAVANYIVDGYDVTSDEVAEYTAIFMDINARYNSDETGALVSAIDKAEARRLLKVTESARRNKLFKICFALHLDNDEAHDFLTRYMCERDYNYRSPEEAIAFYCFSTPEANSYASYMRILAAYNEKDAVTPVTDEAMQDYSQFAATVFEREIDSEDELISFLLEHRSNFKEHSQTAKREYTRMYEAIKRKLKLENPEQVARALLDFIPRETKNGVGEFVSVNNNGADATNDLPNCIISNLMVSDRIHDLLTGKKAVDRKDLVFMKFFLTSLDVNEVLDDGKFWEGKYKGQYNASAACGLFFNRFVKECDHALTVSGFSPISPLNKYENLILISLASDRPFEIFAEIIENSFFEFENNEDSSF